MVIYVSSPSPKDINAYSPPKEPGFTISEPPIKWWPFIAGAIFLGILLAWLYKRRQLKPPAMATFIPSANGMAMLQGVKVNWAENAIDSLQLGEGLVQSLTLHYGVPARKTTRQLLKVIKRLHGAPESSHIEETLKNTDAWRFGKQTATKPEGKVAIERLEGLMKRHAPANLKPKL